MVGLETITYTSKIEKLDTDIRNTLWDQLDIQLSPTIKRITYQDLFNVLDNILDDELGIPIYFYETKL